MPDAFASMIAGLESHGLSRADIAAQANVGRATVWRLANSASKDHLSATAARVERLHERIVGCDATKKGVES